MKKMILGFILLITWNSHSQELFTDELQGYNLFILPAPQINVQLSLDSTQFISPTTGFSITPDVETIDMVAIYNETQELQPKPYQPNSNTDFGRLRFKGDEKTVSFSLRDNDRFVREFRNSNPAFFEANRNTALHRSYNPLSCYNTAW